MNKKLATIAFTGLMAALPFAAQAGGSRHYDDCDHWSHRSRSVHHHHHHHGRGYEHRRPRDVVYVPVPAPAPRVHVPVYYPPLPPIPRGGVDIVWRIGF